MTMPEDDGLADGQAPNWQERPAPGPRAVPPEKDDAAEDLAAHLWGEPEDDDA